MQLAHEEQRVAKARGARHLATGQDSSVMAAEVAQHGARKLKIKKDVSIVTSPLSPDKQGARIPQTSTPFFNEQCGMDRSIYSLNLTPFLKDGITDKE